MNALSAASIGFLALTVSSCYPPKPYVNPLSPQQVETLSVRRVGFDDAPEAGKGGDYAAARDYYKRVVIRATINHLGRKYDPQYGTSELLFTLTEFHLEGSANSPESVSSSLSAKVLGPGIHGTYSVGLGTTGAVQTERGILPPGERITLNAEDQANMLVGKILSIQEPATRTGLDKVKYQ